MQACLNWILIIFGTRVIKKERAVRPVFSDCLSVFYDYDLSANLSTQKNDKTSKISKSDQPIDICYLAFTYGYIAIISI